MGIGIATAVQPTKIKAETVAEQRQHLNRVGDFGYANRFFKGDLTEQGDPGYHAQVKER